MHALLLAQAALLLLPTAFASSDGAIAPSAVVGGFDCGQCHNQTGKFLDLAPEGYRAAIQLQVVDGDDADVLALGETRRLRLTVDSAATATTGETGRKLGFGIAMVAQGGDGWTRTGQLEAVDDRADHPPFPDSDLTHTHPLPQVDGRVQLELELTPEQAGDQLIYVVINDVDGDGEPSAGDYVWPQRFCFVVEEAGTASGEECDAMLGWGEAEAPGLGGGDDGSDSGAGEADAPKGGGRCQASPGAAAWLWGTALLVIRSRRRRR